MSCKHAAECSSCTRFTDCTVESCGGADGSAAVSVTGSSGSSGGGISGSGSSSSSSGGSAVIILQTCSVVKSRGVGVRVCEGGTVKIIGGKVEEGKRGGLVVAGGGQAEVEDCR